MNELYIEYVRNNMIKELKELLREHNDIYLEYDNHKAQLLCCSYNYCDILKLLIEHKINLKKDGYCIVLALSYNNYEIINLLLENNFPLDKINLIMSQVIIFKKYNFFTKLIQYLPENTINKIIDIAIEKNDIRTLIILLRYKNINNNNKLFIDAINHINNLKNAYDKILSKINYNIDINNYIMSFIVKNENYIS